MSIPRVVLCALAWLLVAFASARVIELDGHNFEHLTQAATGATTGAWFVMFYSTTCPHSNKLAPIWEKLGQGKLSRGCAYGFM